MSVRILSCPLLTSLPKELEDVREIYEEVYKSERANCEMPLLIVVIEVFPPLKVFLSLLAMALLEGVVDVCQAALIPN